MTFAKSLISRNDKDRVFQDVISLMRSLNHKGYALDVGEKQVVEAFVSGRISDYSDVPVESVDDVISIIQAHWDIEAHDTDIVIDLLSAHGLVATESNERPAS